jgi:hypothetical protein
MNILIFNCSLFLGWAMASIGAGLWWPPAGLMFGGVSLVALTLLVARKAGVFR